MSLASTKLMISKILTRNLYLFFMSIGLLLGSAGTKVSAQGGTSCQDAISFTGSYQMNISGAGEVWFTAYTYDLPLTMVFIPSNQSSTYTPVAEFDFTCTPGVYDHPTLRRWFGPNSSGTIVMPQRMTMERKVEDGITKYVLTVPESTRNMLASAGLTDNLQAYVKMRFYEAGIVSIASDNRYSTCMTGGTFLRINEHVDVAARDTNVYSIVPYSTFRKDSIHYVWEGTSPAKVWLMKDCNELSVDTTNIMESWTMQPGDTLRLTMQQVREKDDYYDAQGAQGGLVYFHVTSASVGRFHIRRTPMAPAENNAILLRFGIPVPADSNIVYCFPKTWKDPMSMVTESSSPVTVYFGKTGFFDYHITSSNNIGKRDFVAVPDGYEADFSTKDINNLVYNIASNKNYIYVRFRSNDPSATVTLWDWNISDCASTSSVNLSFGTPINMPEGRNLAYRVRYADIVNHSMSVAFTLSAYTATFYVAKDCSTGYNASNPNVFHYETLTAAYNSFEISAQEIATWPPDENGYVYITLKTRSSSAFGFVLISLTPEPEPEPECEKTIHAAVSAATPHGRVQIQFVNE